MVESRVALYLILAVANFVLGVESHGRMLNPPGRSTMWRYGFDTAINYQDNELFCGGFQHQWKKHDGKCGLCGDPYEGPRENEAGGKYASNKIAANYTSGSTVTLKVELTANHLGWVEFKMCANDDWTKNFTQQCLDENVLQLADGSGSRYSVGATVGLIPVTVTLPEGLVCSQCVIQWRYHSGNSWGVDKDSGEGCIGCGPQEEFYACADVRITGSGSTPAGTTAAPTTSAPTGATSTEAPTAAPSTEAPTAAPSTEDSTAAPSTPYGPEVTSPDDTTDWSQCRAAGAWEGQENVSEWCRTNCPFGHCPESMCRCD